MPSPETSDRYQKAVLWSAGPNDKHGEPTVLAPIELNVRWQDRRSPGVGDAGETIATDATVVVDRQIAINSIMWKGELANFNPAVNSGELMQVANYSETPDIKNRVAYREVTLRRFRSQLPSTVT